MANTISVSVVADVAALRRGLDESNRRLAGFDKKAQGTSKRLKQALTIGAAAAGIKTAVGVMGGMVEAARESAKIGATTNAVIKATGGVAKISASQIGDLADSLSKKTGVDDELIQSGSNLLLTFKKVRNEAGKNNDIFNQATAAAVDLSAAGFGSVESASKMLGKALNDPVKGMSAMSRAGVTFTDSQQKQVKAMVKAGDTLGAQKLIMKEIQSQVGGTAAAQATSADKLKVAWGNLQETLGAKLIPALERLSELGISSLAWAEKNPGKVKAIGTAIAVFGAVVVTAWTVSKVAAVGSLTVQAAAHVATAAGWAKTAAAATVSGATTARIWLMLQADALKSAAAQVVAHARIAAAWVASKVQAAGAAAVQVAANVRTAASYALSSAAAVAHRGVMLATAGAVKVAAAAQWILNAAMRANPIGLVITAIGLLVGGLVLAYKKSETFRAIVQKAFAVVKAAAGALWTGIKTYFGFIFGIYAKVGSLAVAAFKKVASAFMSGVRAAGQFLGAVKDKVGAAVDFVGSIPGKVKAFFIGAGDWLIDAGQKVIGGLIDGIKDKIGDVKSALTNLTNMIPDWKGPAKRDRTLLRNAGQLIMQGLVSGIGDGAAGVKSKLGWVTNQIASTFKQIQGKAMPKALKKEWTRWLSENTRGLQGLANQYQAKMAQVAAATERVNDLIKQRADYAASVASSAMSYANITGAGVGEDGKQSAASIKQGLADRLSAILTFTKQLDALKKKGLNKATYDELVQAGVEGGSETVRALTLGGQAAVSSVNTLQSKISAASKTLGAQTSNTMYSAGIQAAQGLVRGLKSQAANIAKYAKSWAKALTKAVKKALKIKSPSRVFRDEVGKQIVAGLIQGTSKQKVAQAGASMAGSFKDGFGRPAIAGGGSYGAGATIIRLEVNVPPTANPAAVGKEIAKALDAYKRQGGRVSA